MVLKASLIKYRNGTLCTCLLLAILLLANPGVSWGYLLPGKQIIGLMSDNFSKFKSMIMIQSIKPIEPEAVKADEGLKQKIWLQSPSFFYKEMLMEEGGQDFSQTWMADGAGESYLFYNLLFLNRGKEAQVQFISNLGIDIGSVSLIRKENLIAYRIGDPDIKSPCFIMEKDRFLPLEIKCCVTGKKGPLMLSIRFEDYRKVENGWYPHLVTCLLDGVPRFSCAVISIETNPSTNARLSPIPLEHILPAGSCAGNDEYPHEERLKSIIESLKNKYE